VRGALDRSQRRSLDLIEIGPQQRRVDGRQPTPPLQQGGCRETTTHERAQFCDRTPIHGDRERLATGDALQHTAAVVAELAHGDGVHTLSASLVRQTRKTVSANPTGSTTVASIMPPHVRPGAPERSPCAGEVSSPARGSYVGIALRVLLPVDSEI